MLLFILFIWGFVVFPVSVAFFAFRVTESEDPLINLGLRLSIGIVAITLVSILVGLVTSRPSYIFIWIVPIVSLLYVLIKWKTHHWIPWRGISNIHWGIVGVILLGVLTQNIVLYRGGWQTTGGYMFPSIHDTMWNISLATELSHHFPPQHPGMAGEMLKNNHYFYPLFLAVTRTITGLNILDIYFRYAPVLVSLLFGLSLYALSSLYTTKSIFRGIAVFLGYFSGNAAFLLPILIKSQIEWKGSTFFADQPFDQIINPYTVLGFSFFLFGVYLFHQALTSTKNHIFWSILTATLFGSLFGFKSFGGIIAICALAITTGIGIVVFKQLRVALISIFTLSVFIPIFFFITEPSIASLRWAPGWLLTEMISSQDKLPMTKLLQTQVFYESIGNTRGLIKIKGIEFLWYFFGNLGVRIVGLGYLLIFFFKKHTEKPQKITTFFIITSCFVSFSIPLLFNLGSNSYNIIQFTPYSFVFLAVFTALASEYLYTFFSKTHQLFFGIGAVIAIISLAIPVNIKNIIGKFESPHDLVTTDEMKALQYMSTHTDPKDVVLIDLNQYVKADVYGKDPMFISALSERRMYLASPGYATQTGRNPAKRVQYIHEFFRTYGKNTLLTDGNVTYIYLIKPYAMPMQELSLDIFYENPTIIVYRVKR